MKLLTFNYEDKEQIGVLSKDEKSVYPMSSFGLSYESMQQWIEKGSDEEARLVALKLERGVDGAILLEHIQKLAPIPRPKQDIICLGINYLAHAEESARYKKEVFETDRAYPVYFSKRVNVAVPDGADIPAHNDIIEDLDYEVELAVIIGKDAKNVKKEEVLDYIFGYTIINDMSARTLQGRHKQWYFAKSLDGFLPMGPWIVTKDEIPFPPKLAISSKVNGEERQKSNTEKLIFDIAYVIEELSKGMTLQAGTIIATGTPEGVGMGFVPPKFLLPNDVVECSIEGIGMITNTIKA
jgi:2-keto-4-pentenoate hydratase/2-oxohepta-3-ene-1,7-dioic acid hydratase in catechol pathway